MPMIEIDESFYLGFSTNHERKKFVERRFHNPQSKFGLAFDIGLV